MTTTTCPSGRRVPARLAFLLGTHQPGWLTRAGVPLFISDTRLRRYKTLPRAIAPWSVDSGGFSELQRHGTWTVTPGEYLARLRRYRDEIGHLMWAAPQDWMCEPLILHGGTANGLRFVGTGLSVAEHQHRTVVNFGQLRELAPDLPIIPVLQGWTRDDYLRCVDRYTATGVDLTREPLVGLGSVCRRQATAEAGRILAALHDVGLRRLHGFGFKIRGLTDHGDLLTSADSIAWSFDARRLRRPLPGCTGHRNCANCLRYALRWRTSVLAAHQSAPSRPDNPRHDSRSARVGPTPTHRSHRMATTRHRWPAHHPTHPSNGPQNATQDAVNAPQNATPEAEATT